LHCIILYFRAIDLDASNQVFYCNRAAAHSKLNNHYAAIEDCKRAIDMDPKYGKAYGRMGLAYSSVERHKEAVDCFEEALKLEPENESYKTNLDLAKEKSAAPVARSVKEFALECARNSKNTYFRRIDTILYLFCIL
jgi:tetratricopeptide (TPR) repeat protein